MVNLKTCHVVWNEARGIKPSCNFLFGSFKQVNDINKFWGFYKNIFENFEFQKKFLSFVEIFFFVTQIFRKFF